MRTFWLTIVLSCLLSVVAASAVDLFISSRIPIVGQHIGLMYSLNSGIAWGIRLPRGVQEVLILGALAIVAHMAKSAKTTISIQAYALIIGGGLANVIDRLRDGYVTDFFQIGSFPIFNVADSFVTIGVGMLLLEAFLPRSIKGIP
ncbi:signal peptidase II [Candidatus Peregrinibacteria bacterium CG10_big_fil_rev_8_21_14_0_10_42_8]|nr:MAG: signal peptidase II [Candidatus Peregrinibacteria bacterium CG10_big_fil_rev_8_21_14_0_10_42_8]